MCGSNYLVEYRYVISAPEPITSGPFYCLCVCIPNFHVLSTNSHTCSLQRVALGQSSHPNPRQQVTCTAYQVWKDKSQVLPPCKTL